MSLLVLALEIRDAILLFSTCAIQSSNGVEMVKAEVAGDVGGVVLLVLEEGVGGKKDVMSLLERLGMPPFEVVVV